MTETATSPLHHRPSSSSNPNMPPFFSPHVSTPHHQPTKAQRTPSPNYFDFQSGVDTNAFLTDAPRHAKHNWSPPSSAVRSTAAASPSVVPVDQNPEFDAFRRQSQGKAFNLGGLGGNFKMNAPPVNSKHGRSGSRTSPGSKDGAVVKEPAAAKDVPLTARSRLYSTQSLDPTSAELSRSPKRVLSPGSAALPDLARRGPPASFTNGEPERPQSQPRFQLPLDNPNGPFGVSMFHRAETIPERTRGETEPLIATAQHIVNLMDSRGEELLLLDLRVSTQYAKSHITGALNLCIPTTLLKRPSFNVQKLADTFKDDEQKSKFENWRRSSYIIVYDTSSSELKDAQICLNTVKKFKNEGYGGQLYIIKGGFTEFARRFSRYVEDGADGHANGTSTAGAKSDGPEVAPVIGGCPMPANDQAANPFFGNIRQNMDLIGGVGQIPLKHPSKAGRTVEERQLPEWLRRAADDQDQGKVVSGKFEAIERREKKRMEDALSGKVSFGSPKPQESKVGKHVQIAGIEKGNKNRYNNIWPFEHSRVKLQGIRGDGCDYFNASFVQAGWSHKRYISTQAPIPATFNDFWNVVWQQDVRVIVMLTAEKEGAHVKAHNYWDRRQYGPLHLDFLSEKRASLEPSRIHKHHHHHHSKSKRHQDHQRPALAQRSSTTHSNSARELPLAPLDSKEDKAAMASGEQPYVIVRKFTLSHERHPFEPMREITQLQYSSWPDFGAPAHPAHLLGLVEQTDAVVRATNKSHHSRDPEPADERPVLVHCSAGCGRTGTFCTVDSVIDMLKRQRISRRRHPEDREATPMDVDLRTIRPSVPRSPNGMRKSSTDQDGGGGGGGDGFVPSEPHASSTSEGDSGPEGSWVQQDDLDLVEKTVEDFRHQRLSMVQSLRQYVLCYESVMEWLVEQQSPSSEG